MEDIQPSTHCAGLSGYPRTASGDPPCSVDGHYDAYSSVAAVFRGVAIVSSRLIAAITMLGTATPIRDPVPALRCATIAAGALALPAWVQRPGSISNPCVRLHVCLTQAQTVNTASWHRGS